MIDFKLNKIKLFNFACYLGENEIDFTSENNKNIFLFRLPNGYGKTSLFHAIKWGFYGEKIEYFKDSDKIDLKTFLNDKLDLKKDFCYVQIFFEFGKDIYDLKRVYKPSENKNSRLTLVKNSIEIVDLIDAKDELDKILPENFANFFMFDGEQLSKFMTAQKELHYRDSIHQLLGLKQLRFLGDDLLVLKKRYENSLLQEKAHNNEIESKQKTIEGINSEISNFDLKISSYEEDIQKNDELLERFIEHRNNFANLPKVMNQIEEIQFKKDRMLNKLHEIQSKLLLNKNFFFVKILEKDIKRFVSENNKRILDLREISGFSDKEAMIQELKGEILKKSMPICDVCGHKLTIEEKKKMKKEQDEIKKKLEKFNLNRDELNSLKDQNHLFNIFLEKIKDIDYQELIDLLQEYNINLDEIDKKLKDLHKESKKKEYGNLAEINREIDELIEVNSNKSNQIKLLREQKNGYSKRKDIILREIKSSNYDNDIIDNISKILTYISNLEENIKKTLIRVTESKRELILKKSNELFIKITNKPDEYKGIEFENSDSFSFVIKTKENRKVTNPSKGEKQVLAMSFLIGLSQYTGRNNVILMDTPVASLDDIHSAGIGKALAQLNNQVIFLAQPQELSGDIYINMKKGISKEFKVTRKDLISKIEEI